MKIMPLILSFTLCVLMSSGILASVAVSFSPYLDNLLLEEGMENVFRITIINYYPRRLVVTVTDNNDNRIVLAEYPSTILVDGGSPNEGAINHIDVKVRSRSPGTFWFSLDIKCLLVEDTENIENAMGAAVVRAFGVNFKGEVLERKEFPSNVWTVILVSLSLILIAVLIAAIKARR